MCVTQRNSLHTCVSGWCLITINGLRRITAHGDHHATCMGKDFERPSGFFAPNKPHPKIVVNIPKQDSLCKARLKTI